MSRVIRLFGALEALDRERCGAVADFLERGRDGGESPAGGGGNADPGAVLARLAERGVLTFRVGEDGAGEVLYVPSREAKEGVAGGGGAEAFPKAIHKKHKSALRAIPGALFHFPAEDPSEGRLTVFITDWSPCPAAAAVAVHRDHPWAAGPAAAAGHGFTGRFVRHPLTGDLLPVWVGEWVRPEFGTGAVLVNPAHDEVDLGFAREVGLPLRFGLVPEGFDGSPETWPDPPVVRTGRAIKTGGFDGLGPEEALEAYFEALSRHGFAERSKALVTGPFALARMTPDAGGSWRFDPEARALRPSGEAGSGGAAVGLEEADLLAAARATADGGAPVVVVPASERVETLLALRLLHFDLTGSHLAPSGLVVVQTVQDTSVEVPDDVRRVALLAGSPPGQVAVLKQQVVEQAARFVRVHGELEERGAEPGGEEDKALGAARAAVEEGDPAKAFSHLYRAQKELAGAEVAPPPAYFDLASLLIGSGAS